MEASWKDSCEDGMGVGMATACSWCADEQLIKNEELSGPTSLIVVAVKEWQFHCSGARQQRVA